MVTHDSRHDEPSRRLQRRLTDLAVIERAVGAVMEQSSLNAEQARSKLAQEARAAGRTLADHCARVLAHTADTAPLLAPTHLAPLVRRRLVTADAEQACQELADAFGTQIHMTTSTPEGVFRLEHIDAGRFCTGQHELPGRLSFTSEPAAQVVVARLLAGTAHRRTPTGEERLGPDDVFLTGQPATVHTAATTNTRVRTVTLPLPLLHKVAGELPGQGSPLRFTALRPATPALAAHWRATRVYVKDLLDRPDLDTAAPLLAANVAHLLAATALVVFPNTVTASADGPHDRTATPDTVRRAMTFIEEHADRDITLADIASAACVTPRALQYAFRRHLDTTPLAYLRDARLHRAHHDLVDADPALDTVTRIAARWGFLHPGRFATRYQQAYHCTPSSTLHA